MKYMGFDEGWRFHLGDLPTFGNQPTPDDTWRELDLPHDWSIEHPPAPENPSKASGGFLPTGTAWYAKTFKLLEDVARTEERVILEFGGIYRDAEVWLNQNLVTRHPYGYTSFHADLTPYLDRFGDNLLAIRVDNNSQPACRWYSGSGIYRHVRLLTGGMAYVDPWGVYITTPEVSTTAAKVRVNTRITISGPIEDNITIRSTICSKEGEELTRVETNVKMPLENGKACCSQEIGLGIPYGSRSPRPWSPDSPNLYVLRTSLMIGGRIVDTETTPFGIRTISFSAQRGFLLNGFPIKLKGGCVHHDHGPLGAASYDQAEVRKAELLKANGFNAVRCAHNPPSPAFLDACDRLGLLVIDEAFDCWRIPKQNYDYHIHFEDWWKRDLESMILRDRNHPCIIMWSIGNEIPERDGRSDGARISRELAEHTRELDPTRPVTGALCEFPGDWDKSIAGFEALDICGYNYLEALYRPDHIKHPKRVMYGSESMPWFAKTYWDSVMELPYVIGDFVWTAMDYLGEAGLGMVRYQEDEMRWTGDYPWIHAFCGDIDICGWKRPQSYYRDMVWGNGCKLWFGVELPTEPGKTVNYERWSWPDVVRGWEAGYAGGAGTAKVVVYSVCDEVELLLNGRSLGRMPAGKGKDYLAGFAVPFEPGELRVIGYEGGRDTVEDTLRTAGPAASIKLVPDRSGLNARKGDLCYITAVLTDRDGTSCTLGDMKTTFQVAGPGTLAAMGNGDPHCLEAFQGTPENPVNSRTTYRGQVLAIVKSDGRKGTITITADVEGLPKAVIELECI